MRPGLATAVAIFIAGNAVAAPMSLGVNTHFDQGWPLSDIARVQDSGAQAVRDTVTWGKVEQQPGRYDFTPSNSGYVSLICSRSIPVLLMITPRNWLYDGGMAVYSPTGQQALARYIGKLVDRFPCVIGIEIGNEINHTSVNWPDPAHKPAMYVSMLRAVHDELHRHKRPVALVGGSSFGVAADFQAQLFAAGELSVIDAVSVHPYIKDPDLLPGQFAKLHAAMTARGGSKPVWATEFGNYSKTPDMAPPFALKVMTIMSAAGIRAAFWYALVDEPWFPNMGLYSATGPKPALDTYRLALRHLLTSGDARRVPIGDATSHVYRFGNGPYVLWGQGAQLRLPPSARVYDARGRAIAAPAALGADPIVVESSAGFELR